MSNIHRIGLIVLLTASAVIVATPVTIHSIVWVFGLLAITLVTQLLLEAIHEPDYELRFIVHIVTVALYVFVIYPLWWELVNKL